MPHFLWNKGFSSRGGSRSQGRSPLVPLTTVLATMDPPHEIKKTYKRLATSPPYRSRRRTPLCFVCTLIGSMTFPQDSIITFPPRFCPTCRSFLAGCRARWSLRRRCQCAAHSTSPCSRHRPWCQFSHRWQLLPFSVLMHALLLPETLPPRLLFLFRVLPVLRFRQKGRHRQLSMAPPPSTAPVVPA